MTNFTAPPASLPRRLGLWDAAATLCGIMLGSGIFVAPAVVAQVAPTAGAAAVMWLGGGALALAGALVYAECAARLPHDGGFFVFYGRAFGPGAARVAGWAAVGVSYPASLAGVALIGAAYLSECWPAWDGAQRPVAAAILLGATCVNALGVRLGALAQRLLTASKLVAIGALALAVYTARPATAVPVGLPTARGAGGWLAAFAVLMWTFDGWTDVTLMAGEVRDPERTLRRAACVAVGLLTAIYAGVQVAVMALLSPAGAARTGRVVAAAAEQALGPAYGRLTGALVGLSALGAVHGMLMTTSRLAYAMARDGALPAALAAIHPRRQTPVRALWAVATLACLHLLTGSFTELVSLSAAVIWLFYGGTAVALWRLRRAGGATRQATGAPTVLLFAASAMVGLQAYEQPKRLLGALAALALAGALQRLWRPAGPHGATAEPASRPPRPG